MGFNELKFFDILKDFCPEIIMFLGIILNLVIVILSKRAKPGVSNVLTICFLGAAAILSITKQSFFGSLIYLCSLVCSLFSIKFTKRLTHKVCYFNALLLSLALGAVFLAGSKNFLTLFVSLEIVSISSYLLVAVFMNRKSLEGSVKYFIQGAVASCVALFAISYIYGVFGTIDFLQIAQVNERLNMGLLALASTLLFCAIAFKLAVVPFCFWVSDTLQGADYSVGLILSTVSKVAAVALFVKLAWLLLPANNVVRLILILCALLTLIFSNLLAMRQRNIKRFLGYSTISHAGYILFAVAILTPLSINAALFYLVAYLIASFGLWAGFGAFYLNNSSKENLEDMDGIAYQDPVFATMMGVCLLSLAGMPPMLGFVAKFYMFVQILSEGLWTTVPMLVLIFASIVALFYYTKIFASFFKRAVGAKLAKKLATLRIILTVASFLLIILVFFSKPLIEGCGKILISPEIEFFKSDQRCVKTPLAAGSRQWGLKPFPELCNL